MEQVKPQPIPNRVPTKQPEWQEDIAKEIAKQPRKLYEVVKPEADIKVLPPKGRQGETIEVNFNTVYQILKRFAKRVAGDVQDVPQVKNIVRKARTWSEYAAYITLLSLKGHIWLWLLIYLGLGHKDFVDYVKLAFSGDFKIIPLVLTMQVLIILTNNPDLAGIIVAAIVFSGKIQTHKALGTSLSVEENGAVALAAQEGFRKLIEVIMQKTIKSICKKTL
jgi:hypothetical protein